MLCPKCGFISFDIVEKCVKCGKDVSGAAAELKGTVTSVPPPGFLTFDRAGSGGEPAERRAEPEVEEAFEVGGGEDVFVDLSSGGESGPAAEGGFMDLGGEPVVQEAEMLVTAEEPAEASMDLSDLAPAEEVAGQVAESGPEEVAFAMGDQKPAVFSDSAAAEAAGQGLEDLKVEGIDLDSTPAPPPGKDKVVPSVKTGTALDNFDVDPKDLFGKK